MVAAGVTVHYAFAAAGILPQARPDFADLVTFAINYTPFLNILMLAFAAFLIVVARRGSRGGEQSRGTPQARA